MTGARPNSDTVALPREAAAAREAAPASVALAALRARALWRLARTLLLVVCGILAARLAFPWLAPALQHRLIGHWSRQVLRALGVRVEQHGGPHDEACLLVANHVSWLDIMALHATCAQARFVAMAELQQWPGVAGLVDAAGTIYLQRERKRDLLRVVREATAALRAGGHVAVFPEGVVSDGRGLPRFHANLLQAAIDAGVPVQPVALRYADVAGPVSDAVRFTGAITLGQSLWRIAHAEGLVLHVRMLPARSSVGEKRRALAARLHADVAAALPARTPGRCARER
jgi:1-acyl-sn-glycerol-3-phosphate acyltransferase